MIDGHIHLARKILEGDLCPKGKFSRFEAWIYLLLNANGITKKWQGILIERGTLPTYQIRLASEWKWSIGNVNKFLKYLKSENRIETKPTNRFTLIKIVNYEKFNPLNENLNENLSENKVKLHNKDNKDNKEKKDNNTNVLKPTALTKGNEDINKIIQTFKDKFGTEPTPVRSQRYYCNHLLKKYKLEAILIAIEFARTAVDEQYAPAICSPKDLYYKWDQLRIFYAREHKKGSSVIEE